MNTTSIMQPIAKESETSVTQRVTKESGNSLMRNIAKAAGALALYLGILSWKGISQSPIPFHIISGSILGLLIMAMGVRAARAGLPTWTVALALVWGIVLGLISINQINIFPILHMVGSLGAIGISERLAFEIKKRR